MEGTMKKLVYHGPRNITLEEAPIPQHGDDGILVKVARCGICGSDIHAYTKEGMMGGLWLPDCDFGHEFVGTVVEVGKNVTDYVVGDRVWVDPTYSKPDPRMSCMAGGFAEYAVSLRAVEGETVFKLPDNVPFSKAVLLEPFGVGVHTKNRGGAKPGQNVLMYGAGPIGLMGWAAMKHQGIDSIVAVEQMPMRIEFAKELGVNIFSNAEAKTWDIAAEQFGTANISSYERANVDLCIDYVGFGALIGEYMENGRPNSTFATLGLDRTPLTITPGEFMSKQFTITGSRAYAPADIAECIDVLANGKVPIEKIITGVYPMEEATEAFEEACDKNRGYKVVINIADPEE